MENNILKVVLIEDDIVIRESYTYLINETLRFQVANSYSSAEYALKSIKADDPHIVLLDVELPGMNGLEALPKIKMLIPEAHIVMLTVYEDAKTVFEALGKGASGYLTKDTSSLKIIEAMEEVILGGGPMSASIARMVVDSFQKNQSSPLTKRETEILEHISNGKTRSRVASELFIDMETVKSHLKNIYAKLDVHSRADAIKTAKQNRYI